ncbi:hypothetical protein IWQ56_000329 [Coemansia nantahalensis]|uniref:Uncharacterized protein n=2 Tax=Coemansia TaxID=4863 RepID=A0ACC1KYE7_9FUNG|nr:hypothetical protein IWQ56_000329 [Coemansia nantahalensis]KAJ2775044.1 hypothetical protein IWQ57_000565 [Coemansia nantahalensis]KAJ2797773.1 hypothetical protein H4R21_004185 [Coemansia helicoidea]
MRDAEQTRSAQRQLRHDYRSLLSDAAARKKEYLADDGVLLREDLERANALFGSVESTAEGVLDSRFLVLSADLGAQRARMLRIDGAAFDSLEYIDKLRDRLYSGGGGTDAPDWAAVGAAAARFARQAPRIAYMYGPLMTTPRDRRRSGAAQRAKTQAGDASQAAAAVIETMGEDEVRQQENQTTRLVKRIHRILSDAGSINLLRLVINPHSFAQSVENIFYVSFLIRDGRAFIDDASGQPMIEACEPPQQEDYQSGLTKKQLIFTLDQATWREIVDAYAIAEPVIPQRPSARDELGNSQIAPCIPR